MRMHAAAMQGRTNPSSPGPGTYHTAGPFITNEIILFQWRPLAAKLLIGFLKINEVQNCVDLLHHHNDYGGVRTGHAVGKGEYFLFAYLCICHDGKDCANGIAMKPYEF